MGIFVNFFLLNVKIDFYWMENNFSALCEIISLGKNIPLWMAMASVHVATDY